MLRTWMFLVLLCSAGAAAADPTALLNDREPFAQQRERVESALRKGDTYEGISSNDRSKVMTALARMGNKLEGGLSPQELQARDKVEFFNDQELVNALLDKARADSRVVCERYRPVGSKMPQNICLTVAERRQQREEAVDEIRSIKRAEEPISR